MTIEVKMAEALLQQGRLQSSQHSNNALRDPEKTAVLIHSLAMMFALRRRWRKAFIGSKKTDHVLNPGSASIVRFWEGCIVKKQACQQQNPGTLDRHSPPPVPHIRRRKAFEVLVGQRKLRESETITRKPLRWLGCGPSTKLEDLGALAVDFAKFSYQDEWRTHRGPGRFESQVCIEPEGKRKGSLPGGFLHTNGVLKGSGRDELGCRSDSAERIVETSSAFMRKRGLLGSSPSVVAPFQGHGGCDVVFNDASWLCIGESVM
ncbi:hypothetical protein BN1723_008573 [Verticillium longisporum]|uniref:Uncharacterized protein n=1 Tax=Verticillium longisporum TaxID=100787 RepID=A0A0G4KH86_VERLO|nr:hypothetical protein BN1723_008573 [Verticillium longisporum]CRK37461.1 hypothetical protein BN1708_001482 [Verticillium longisporum]